MNNFILLSIGLSHPLGQKNVEDSMQEGKRESLAT